MTFLSCWRIPFLFQVKNISSYLLFSLMLHALRSMFLGKSGLEAILLFQGCPCFSGFLLDAHFFQLWPRRYAYSMSLEEKLSLVVGCYLRRSHREFSLLWDQWYLKLWDIDDGCSRCQVRGLYRIPTHSSGNRWPRGIFLYLANL